MSNEITTNRNWFVDLLKACWGVLNFTRKAILNIIFIILAVLFFAAMSSKKEQPIVFENNSVLELRLNGTLVEEKAFVDPYGEVLRDAMGDSSDRKEILLTDVMNALDYAAEDPKITMVLLDLQGLSPAGLSKLQEVAIAIKRFKETSEKPVVVYGDYFTQDQYYLAAHADHVFLHPMGSILMTGYNRHRTYYKSALEKLKVTSHIFRVGTFKSAIEPYIRDDMSAAAKEANTQWLSQLWNIYKADVSEQRDLTGDNFDDTLSGFLDKFKTVNGSFANLAKINNWVDNLMTHQEFDAYLKEQLETEEETKISFNKYLSYVGQQLPTLSKDRVGIVVASGTIYDGHAKPGEIGGYSTAALLKRARLDDNVKAIVLRVDSGGGSAFASEIIRNEIEAIKAAGKPIVTSMSSVAASGGYWIAASTDEIWAAPTTITCSIGIFGMFLTFEDSLAELGIFSDGVGTSEMGNINIATKLPNQMSDIIQLSIENGYRQFLQLVANERNMTVEEVDNIAQGRVWSGVTAKEHGLVDKLGYFDDAIAAAAEKANLTDYTISTIKAPAKGFEKIIQEFLGMANIDSSDLLTDVAANQPSGLAKVLKAIIGDATKWVKFNDPKHAYVYCLECEAIN